MKKLLIIESIIIAAVVAAKFYIEKIAFFPPCFIRENFGIFCPSCNFTSCVIALSNLDFAKAFMLQPILVIALAYLFLLNIVYIIFTVKGEKMPKAIYPKPWYAIVFAVLIIIYAGYMNLSGNA